jgi:glyoxylase-like metal-dependent hydrolase (beta-lactamase superfamily II)/rhodanese-related sulfurtransferase
MGQMIFHQLFEKESSTYTYIVADSDTNEAVIIDPVIEMVERDLALLRELGVHLKYVLDTHVHADHVTGSGELRRRTGAKVGVSAAYDMACVDLHLNDGQELKIGSHHLRVLHTPGHTSGCLSYVIEDRVFTGDALLIRGCGRTDFQGGSAERLFESIRTKIFSLPETTMIFPGHDYKGFTHSTVGLERNHNPRLRDEMTREQFVELMANLNLAYPKKIKEAVLANLACGLPDIFAPIDPQLLEGIPVVTAPEIQPRLGQILVIDVRGYDEFNGELGHIPTARLISLGEGFNERLSKENRELETVFVCRSGKRSLEAARRAHELGFARVYSLSGGMLQWNELNLPRVIDLRGS